jgi:putative membrane protein
MNLGLLAIFAGGAVVIAMVAWFGASSIGVEVLDAAWVVPITTVLLGFQLYFSAIAWRISMDVRAPSVSRFLRIRWIREGVNSLLPVAQLGGNLVGIRLLVQRGVGGVLAAAGTVLDLTIEALTQFLFTLAGFVVLAAIDAERSWAPWVGGVLLSGALGIGGFILAQRIGLMRLVEVAADKLAGMFPALAFGSAEGLHQELLRLQKKPAALLQASALHLLAWGLGTIEVWLALSAMGQQPSIAEAFVIESLGMAARSAGFAVPGALGVQEGGLILVCGLFGVSPDLAIALSMIKRLRELVVGIPALIAWQLSEGKRILRRRRQN